MPNALPAEISNQLLFANLDLVLADSLQAILLLVCVALLHRAAYPLHRPRFLRHLAHCMTSIFVFYAGDAVVFVLKTLLAVPVHGIRSDELAVAYSSIDNIWLVIGLFTSFFSSFWLISAGYLAGIYPQVAMPRAIFSQMVAVFGALGGLVVALQKAVATSAGRTIFDLLDTALSMLAIAYFGGNVCRLLIRRGRGTLTQHVVLGVAALSSGLWFLGQALYLGSLYFPSVRIFSYSFLLVTKLGVSIATVLIAVFTMPEKRPFRGSSLRRVEVTPGEVA